MGRKKENLSENYKNSSQNSNINKKELNKIRIKKISTSKFIKLNDYVDDFSYLWLIERENPLL